MIFPMSQRADLTFKHNRNQGRHGWLRLTPAYSVKVVHDILAEVGPVSQILDPFSGTGTTGLVCAEAGIACDLVEINPFLAWVAKVKTATYSAADLVTAQDLAGAVTQAAAQPWCGADPWIPPLAHIERWWAAERLMVLARLFHHLQQVGTAAGNEAALALNLLGFCRVAIAWSNAAFNHQSMSFKDSQPSLFASDERDLILDAFLHNVRQIIQAAGSSLPGSVTVCTGDARQIDQVAPGLYDCVLTSPPYPNRFSYIREVRPYMYWLGYLQDSRMAGDLDWQAIGGTWGSATSRVGQWQPDPLDVIAYPDFVPMITAIQQHSPVLANYVYKYFVDITIHLDNLRRSLAPGAKVFYVVGNSKFYDTIVPVEAIYTGILSALDFQQVSVRPLRKRNSKKELYEFVVSAEYHPGTVPILPLKDSAHARVPA